MKQDLIAMINQMDIDMLLKPHASWRLPRSENDAGFNVGGLLDAMNKSDDNAGQQGK